MHDLNPELRRELQCWRAELLGRSSLTSNDVAELEDHLLCAIDRALDEGVAPDRAFTHASHSLGAPAIVATEFAKENPPMTLRSKLVGAAITMVLCALVVGPSQAGLFVSIPSLLLLVGIVCGGLWAAFGPGPVLATVRASLNPERLDDPEKHALYLDVCQRGTHLSWAGGVFGTLMGTILTLGNLSDPSQLGVGVALSLTSLLYGALLSELGFRTMRQWLKNHAPVAVRSE